MDRGAARKRRRRPAHAEGEPFEGIASGPTLMYVVVPDELPYKNRGRFWSGEQLVPRCPRLVITRDVIRNNHNLIFCDERWTPLYGTSDATLEGARHDAERFYPGIDSHWVDLGLSEADVQAYMEKLRRAEGCSFCRRAPAEHGGTSFEVRRTRICGQCVKKFYAEMQGEASERTRDEQA
jgi:hypothetical protein